MPETEIPTEAAQAVETPAAPGRGPDDVALELMKFIAVATGYGRTGQPSAGFSAKPSAKSPEEHAEELLELFQRCRRAVKQS